MKITGVAPLLKQYYKNPEINVVQKKVGSHGEYSELFNGNKIVSLKKKIPKISSNK